MAAAPTHPVHIIGASGRSGLALCRALLADGVAVVPVVRDAAKWRGSGIDVAPRIADLGDAAALAAALGDAQRVVCCAHARFAPAVLAATASGVRHVFLGSTRKFTRWPDQHANGVLAGEAAFVASGRSGVMLHPTMIYGAQGENNVQRLAALLRRLPIVPLPGGGHSLVQPIYQDDVTRCIRAALEIAWQGPHSLVIAGATALSYAAFAREVAHAAGLPPPRCIAVPAWLLMAAIPLARLVPALPAVGVAELRRLLEDKAFDIGPMRATLGVDPISLADGLANCFAEVKPSR
jgi:nucleoside-diphosphate-sugar epimerase